MLISPLYFPSLLLEREKIVPYSAKNEVSPHKTLKTDELIVDELIDINVKRRWIYLPYSNIKDVATN